MFVFFSSGRTASRDLPLSHHRQTDITDKCNNDIPLNLQCMITILIIILIHRIKEELGRGQFGVVYRGVLQNPCPEGEGEGELEVAVKSLESVSCEEDTIKFLQEAAIMGQFRKHPNILSILGIALDSNSSVCVYVRLSVYIANTMHVHAVPLYRSYIVVLATVYNMIIVFKWAEAAYTQPYF